MRRKSRKFRSRQISNCRKILAETKFQNRIQSALFSSFPDFKSVALLEDQKFEIDDQCQFVHFTWFRSFHQYSKGSNHLIFKIQKQFFSFLTILFLRMNILFFRSAILFGMQAAFAVWSTCFSYLAAFGWCTRSKPRVEFHYGPTFYMDFLWPSGSATLSFNSQSPPIDRNKT